MKIKYAKERLNSHLKMGWIFIGLGVLVLLLSFMIGTFEEISLTAIGIGQIAGGVAILIYYHFENRKNYLTIQDGVLIKHSLIPGKLNLDEVQSIRTFAGELKLKTTNGEFVIDTKIIDPASLAELKEALKKLSAPWN